MRYHFVRCTASEGKVEWQSETAQTLAHYYFREGDRETQNAVLDFIETAEPGRHISTRGGLIFCAKKPVLLHNLRSVEKADDYWLVAFEDGREEGVPFDSATPFLPQKVLANLAKICSFYQDGQIDELRYSDFWKYADWMQRVFDIRPLVPAHSLKDVYWAGDVNRKTPLVRTKRGR